ncbi:MAG: rRNA maturation RNase YbeY [Myxococcota bacterium]
MSENPPPSWIITVDEEHTHPPLQEILTVFGHALLGLLDFPNTMLSLTICDDPHIQSLNKTWRDKDQPTDVLSFPMLEHSLVTSINSNIPIDSNTPTHLTQTIDSKTQSTDAPPLILGDIVISAQTCARQAASFQHAYEQEAKRLFIHGFLHLCGYDHEQSEQEALHMRQREEWCLQQLNVGTEPLTRL